jgi:hypothetical protein
VVDREKEGVRCKLGLTLCFACAANPLLALALVDILVDIFCSSRSSGQHPHNKIYKKLRCIKAHEDA